MDGLLAQETQAAFTSQVETHDKAVANAQRYSVVDLGPRHYQVASLLVQVGEVQSASAQVAMTGMLEVVQINGIVDHPLQVTLVVADFQLQLVSVFSQR